MELALESLLGQGILGVFLVIVIIYFRSELKKRDEMIKELQGEIKTLNEKLHGFGIDAVMNSKAIADNIKELVYEIKK